MGPREPCEKEGAGQGRLEHTTEHKYSQGIGSKAEQPKQPETSITVAARGVKQPHPEPARTRQQNDGNPEEPTEETREKDPYQER